MNDAAAPVCAGRGRSALRLIIAVLVVASGLAATGASSGASLATPADDETAFVSLINQSRAGNGLAGLDSDSAAAQVARTWSQHMAGTGVLAHNPNLAAQVSSQVTSEWQRIGENVGVGYSVSTLHDAFMASTGHRANILGDYNRVGVGVARSGTMLWVTVVFVKGPSLRSPFGSFEVATQVPGGLRVSGWAIDPDTTAPIEVHVYVDASGANLGAAGAARPDVGAAFAGYGSNHGFDQVVAAAPGWRQVCAYGINVGSGANRSLGCRSVYVGFEPFGSFDAATRVPGGLRVSGWAIDPDTAAPIEAHVYVDASGANLGAAGVARPDVGAAFAAYGSNHGFDQVVAAAPGWRWVCAYGINVGWGANRSLGCKSVYVSFEPFGSFNVASQVPGGLRVSGWAIDPETAAPIEVHVYVDASGANLGAAGVARPDVAAVFAGYGSNHGFDQVVAAAPGWRQVCAYAINVGWGANRSLGCRSVYIS